MKTIHLALFGHPVSNSPSPAVHRAFGAQFGLDIDYRLIDATTYEFPTSLNTFHQSGGIGCNITLPLKPLAFELAPERSSRASLAEAANTLWWTPGGVCHADNTDGEGVVRDLEHNLGFEIAGKRLLVLGAGGAAAGVLGALLRKQPSRLGIANRTLSRAGDLASRHAALAEIAVMGLADVGEFGPVDLMVDATSMGHSGELPQLPDTLARGGPVCYSLNYGPAASPMKEWCAQTGMTFQDGSGMLVEQAACSFEIWTGKKPDTGPVLKALRSSSL
jgi:shikimate dehydrogenase